LLGLLPGAGGLGSRCFLRLGRDRRLGGRLPRESGGFLGGGCLLVLNRDWLRGGRLGRGQLGWGRLGWADSAAAGDPAGAGSNTLAATIAGSMPADAANSGSSGAGSAVACSDVACSDGSACASAAIAAASVAGNSSGAGSAVASVTAAASAAASVAGSSSAGCCGATSVAGSGSVTTVTRATAEPARVRRTGGADGSVASAGAVWPAAAGLKAAGSAALGTTGTRAGVSSTRTAVAKAVPADVLRRVRRLPLPSLLVAPLPLPASDSAVPAPTVSDWGASEGASASRSAGEALSG
jgi:hypothetical protein